MRVLDEMMAARVEQCDGVRNVLWTLREGGYRVVKEGESWAVRSVSELSNVQGIVMRIADEGIWSGETFCRFPRAVRVIAELLEVAKATGGWSVLGSHVLPKTGLVILA